MRMNKKEIDRWEKVREKGRKNYIWRVGVTFGLSIAFTLIIVVPLINRESYSEILVRLCIGVVTFPICGYFFGYFMWKYMDKKYQQAKAEEES